MMISKSSAFRGTTYLEQGCHFEPIHRQRGTGNTQVEIPMIGLNPCSYMGLSSSKNMLPLVAYVFTDGPWRDTHVRFGYDPRKDIEARLYVVLSISYVSAPLTNNGTVTNEYISEISGIKSHGCLCPKPGQIDFKNAPHSP